MKSPPAGARVLVVEDAAILARIYSCALSAAGYLVDTASDGAEGFERLLGCSYDVVVTDLGMPRLNGLDLLQEVRRRRPEVPVVMVSGDLDPRTYEMARDMGMVRYLRKPMTMDQLARAVDNAVMVGMVRSRMAAARRATE
jgi:DNA-binding NtrC family response regulator